jgi:hypothetical protein
LSIGKNHVLKNIMAVRPEAVADDMQKAKQPKQVKQMNRF